MLKDILLFVWLAERGFAPAMYIQGELPLFVLPAAIQISSRSGAKQKKEGVHVQNVCVSHLQSSGVPDHCAIVHYSRPPKTFSGLSERTLTSLLVQKRMLIRACIFGKSACLTTQTNSKSNSSKSSHPSIFHFS